MIAPQRNTRQPRPPRAWRAAYGRISPSAGGSAGLVDLRVLTSRAVVRRIRRPVIIRKG